MSKLAKFRSRHGAPPNRNPPLGTDILEYIIPGFAAFAATRFATKLATTQIAKRYPKYAKHAGAIASVGSFAAAWFGAHKVKYLDRYHHPIVVGSGLAALQSLMQLYLPKFAWLVGDPMPTNGAIAQPTKAVSLTSSQQPVQLAAPAPVPPGFKPTTANEWYSYNDSFDAGSYKGKEEGMQSPTPGQTSEPDEMQVSDLLDNSDLIDSDLIDTDMGSFS